jgi:phosphatidylglycerol:prolipoprotein diacylglycerol transferase
MHPILFRIPLLKTPLKLWWALAAVAAVLAIYAALYVKKERNASIGSLLAALALGGLGWAFRHVAYSSPSLPIYSYGVMLGLSLVVGWYVTLSLADKAGLPRDPMATCYVITAVTAIAGARFFYVVMNVDEFKTLSDVFAMRKGGLVAYGGFIGGFLGSWVYLRQLGIRVLPWGDAVAPSLGFGLAIARLGSYLHGGDFGKRLGDSSPEWLQKIGTFPHWTSGTVDVGDGSPAFIRHLEVYRGSPLEAQLRKMDHAFPVHPTQLYESLVGLLLVGLFFGLRKRTVFRGQMFFVVTFAYGVFRFFVEFLRDDTDREAWGPAFSQHLAVPLMLLLMSFGFIFGLSRMVRSERIRNILRVISLLPGIGAAVWLKPAAFASSVGIKLTASQWFAFAMSLLVSFLFVQFWQEARTQPKLAMSLGDGAILTLPTPSPEQGDAPTEQPAEEENDDDPSKDDERPNQV